MVCISLETRSVAKQLSVAVGWVKIKISLMAQLKGLTCNETFKNLKVTRFLGMISDVPKLLKFQS